MKRYIIPSLILLFLIQQTLSLHAMEAPSTDNVETPNNEEVVDTYRESSPEHIEDTPVEQPSNPESTPKVEAVFGYAVVDPNGKVVSVTVCTDSVCGPNGTWAGVMPNDTPWPGYRLVKQTNATADGNVAGWTSSEGMEVTYDDATGHFNIESSYTNDQGATVTHRATIIPELTATDSERMNLHTGYVERDVSYELKTYFEQTLESEELINTYIYNYKNVEQAATQLEADIKEDLKEENNTTVLVEGEEEPQFIQSVVDLVVNLMQRLFGWMMPTG